MRVGILTYHRAHNYGALLQCYSLKTAIEKKGHGVEVIDYWPDYHASSYNYIPHLKSLTFFRKIKAVIYFFLCNIRLLTRYSLYNRFIYKKLGVPKKVQHTTIDRLNELSLDAIVFGSDQIWRRSNFPDFKGFDFTYWGDFTHSSIKKISYAASMGIIDLTEREKTILRQKLNNFSRISVREQALKTLLEKDTGLDVALVLDPVFLTGKIDWEKLCLPYELPIKYRKKYIFFYQLAPSKAAVELCNKLKNALKIDAIEVQGRVNPFAVGSRYFQTAGPEDFINLIKNAEFVVTTSFHGLAFSLIFEKQFFALGMDNNSERALSLLRSLGIENRYIHNEHYPHDANIMGIDYSIVTGKLNELRVKSDEFLEGALL